MIARVHACANVCKSYPKFAIALFLFAGLLSEVRCKCHPPAQLSSAHGASVGLLDC